MPTKFPADGHTYVGWLPDEDGTAIENVESPALADLDALVDLSCDIQSGGLDLGVSTATIDAGSLCDAFVAQAQGRTTVAPTITFWRYQQPDDIAWDLVEKGATGWLVIRTGKAYDAPLAEDDQLTVAWLEMSEPEPEFPGGDTLTTFQSSLTLIDGRKFSQKATVAGA